VTDLPIIINCRDRVSDLRKLIEWLERAGHQWIILLDNDSTYEPLLEFYRETPHLVVPLGENVGSRALWVRDLVPRGEWFVYTDPDVVPVDECPLDAVWVLKETLLRYPEVPKAALGFYLDDVPMDMRSLNIERAYMNRLNELEPGVFRAATDTTFALYRPGAEFSYDAIRLGHPYVARHGSWYVDQCPTEEDRYYLDRALPGPLFSSWKAAT
jgi:hypothetical protein